MSDNKSGVVDEKKNGSLARLIVAKVIAVAIFCIVCLLLFSEVASVATTGIPYLSTYIMDIFGSETVLSSTATLYIYWLLPMFFIVILLALVHYAFIKAILKKLWHWMINVMRKNVS